MPQRPFNPNEAESTGELVLAWNPDAEDDSPRPDTTRTPDLRDRLPSMLDRTIEPGKATLAAHAAHAAWNLFRDSSLGYNLSGGPFHAVDDLRETRSGGPRRTPAADTPIPFPTVGEYFAGFRIRDELGRGSFGRVYLAEQAGLADRLVALKVSRSLGEEPRNLARLQHTHIVPIHSVHDDPVTGLRLLCMPYVGGANLAEILGQIGATSPAEGTGRTLLQALDRVASPGVAPVANALASDSSLLGESPAKASSPGIPAESRPVPTCSFRGSLRRYLLRISMCSDGQPFNHLGVTTEIQPDQPARRFLDRASFTQAAIWIVARLAEALEHAHDRGLLHRDLKPSNILIAADGTPMLLDFNLSAEVRCESNQENARALLGGTLPYMSPEHLDAFNPEGFTLAEQVDERSDVYSLGLILYELITGTSPFDDPPPGLPVAETARFMTNQRRVQPPSARAINPKVPWSLESVVRNCLEPDPARRYQHARDLAEDLRRLLDDRPLRFAPELSWKERGVKWVRRHPRTTSSTSVAVLSLGLIAGLGVTIWGLRDHVAGLDAQSERAAFSTAFRECQLRLNTAPGPFSHVDRGLREARKAIDRYGVLTRPDWTAGPLVARLAPAEQKALLEEMSELLQLTARAEVLRAERSSSRSHVQYALADAVVLLNQAERFDPSPSSSLYEIRALALAALGRTDQANIDHSRAARLPLRSARDFYLSGNTRLAGGDRDGGERELGRAVAIDPKRFWAWFALGLCHHEQGRYIEAAGDFGVCSALFPEFAWPHLNRGLALAASGHNEEARFEYDRAIELSPNFLEGLVNRGLASLEVGDAAGAFRDLDRAVELGQRDAGVQAARAEALSRMGRRDQARRDFDAALAAHPDDPDLRLGRGFFRLAEDPAGAREDFMHVLSNNHTNARAHLGLAHLWRTSNPGASVRAVERALAIDPNFLDALQLRALIRARRGDPSAESDVDRLLQTPSAHRLYNGACALSILFKSHPEARYKVRSLDLLRRSLALGFPTATALSDPDLDPVRDRAEFAATIRAGESRRPGQ